MRACSWPKRQISTLANSRSLSNGKVDYDMLIITTHHHYFGNDHWETLAPGLKAVEDATEMRRTFLAFDE
jgi:NADH:ubiquinone reductase (H+-translocating)